VSDNIDHILELVRGSFAIKHPLVVTEGELEVGDRKQESEGEVEVAKDREDDREVGADFTERLGEMLDYI
jgi:hypothetical protein